MGVLGSIRIITLAAAAFLVSGVSGMPSSRGHMHGRRSRDHARPTSSNDATRSRVFTTNNRYLIQPTYATSWNSSRYGYQESVYMPSVPATDDRPFIVVTGGAGYIGTHTVVELLRTHAVRVIVVDNLSNANQASLTRVADITGSPFYFHPLDVLNGEALARDVFSRYRPIMGVIHFASFKAVGDSVRDPLTYYWNNVAGMVALLQTMDAYNVTKLVVSSSATVYGDEEDAIAETSSTHRATNPYGRTKYFMEEITKDLCESNSAWQVMVLRYFNPVGAHESGLIGEDPTGVPANLMPFMAQVAIGRRSHVNVFGNDYDTPDGTGVRDYIHVVDLSLGHVAAIGKMMRDEVSSNHTDAWQVYNLGSGRGYSVLEMIKSMSKAVGHPIPYKV